MSKPGAARPVARTTAACLLWGQGLAVLIVAGVLLPSAFAGTGPRPRPGVIVATLLAMALVGAAALLVGTGLHRSVRGARAAGLAVQAAMLVAAVQGHQAVVIAAVAAVSVVTVAVLLTPALATDPPLVDVAERPTSGPTPGRGEAPGD